MCYSKCQKRPAESLKKKAETARTEVESLRARLVSLKIDCAKHLEHAVLDVNVQYVENGKIHLQTLTTKVMFERHTAERLKSEFLQVLSRYDVSLEQVYSIMTDNGANMLKTAALLAEESVGSIAARSDQSESEEEDVYAYSEASDGASHLKELEGAFAFSDEEPLLQGMRSQTVLSLLRKLYLRKPILDCVTRWMSTKAMMQRLLELGEFCDEFIAGDDEHHHAQEDWQSTSNISCLRGVGRGSNSAASKGPTSFGGLLRSMAHVSNSDVKN